MKLRPFLILSFSIFSLASALPAQQSPTKASRQTAAATTASGNFIVDTVPVLSTATITSITNNGANSIMICTIPACGLAVGSQIALGEALAVGTNCEGPHTITSVSGNTASFPSTNCVASAGPYANAIGQWAPALELTNAVAYSNDGVQFWINYDDQFSIFAVHSGIINSEEVLDTNGQIQLISPFFGNSFGITRDSKVCLGYAPSVPTDVCPGAGFDSSSGVGQGVLTSYKGLAQTTGHGLSYTVYSSGNSAGHSSSIGPVTLWGCPTSGYGSSDQYEVKAYAVATQGAAGATLQLSTSYTDVSGTVQTKTSGPATPFDTTGQNVQLDALLQCSPGANVTFTITESGAATYAVTVNLILN
jgi:hypothetical protein